MAIGASQRSSLRAECFYGGLQAYEIIAINDQQLVYKGLTGDEKGYVNDSLPAPPAQKQLTGNHRAGLFAAYFVGRVPKPNS